MIRPQTVFATTIACLVIATMTGCAASAVPTQNWSIRMIALLSDPGGQAGGAGGVLNVADGAKGAQGTAELRDVPRGEYDVLAVCTGTYIVHIAVKSAAPAGSVLASSDIACGATLRLHVQLPSTGIVLEAASTGAPAQWQAALVTPGWEPTPAVYSG